MLQTHASFEPVAVTPPCTRNAAIVRLRPQAGSTVACSTCCLKGVCLPCDLDGNELGRFGEIATAKRRVPRGASLYHNGDRLESLYAVRSGLEDSEVCIIPFAQLEQLAMSLPALQHQLLRLLSGDISRDQGLMLLLGSMSAEQRLAAFLLSLSRRHQRLGFAADRFMLRMTREEIGSYLGLTLETVSRLLSRFQRDEWIAVHQRDVEIRNKDRLMEVVGHW